MLSRFVKYIVRSIDRHCNEPSILFHGLNSVGFIFSYFFYLFLHFVARDKRGKFIN